MSVRESSKQMNKHVALKHQLFQAKSGIDECNHVNSSLSRLMSKHCKAWQDGAINNVLKAFQTHSCENRSSLLHTCYSFGQ